MERPVLLSNGGAAIASGSVGGGSRLIVGTVDGIFVLRREAADWTVVGRALEGSSVSSVTQQPSGTLLAATHGLGTARSVDGGGTWEWSNQGLEQFDLWSARSGILRGAEVAFVGSMPAHLFMSVDDGLTWKELPGLRDVASFPEWTFPPPPRLGHVKEIVIDRDRVFVGIEIGALLMSDDAVTFTDLRIDPDPQECDVHRLLINPKDPRKMIASVGLVGLMRTTDGGATWTRDPMIPTMEYPDAFVMHPDEPDLLFVAAGVGWPVHWYARGRAQGRIGRSRDGGVVWERLLGGLPDGQRSLFSALSLYVHDDGFDLFTADTDGQVFTSRDGGDHWTMIADLAPVSKGEFHRGLAKGRSRIAGVDDVSAHPQWRDASSDP